MSDEFTEYNDTDIGIKAVKLLTSLGYRVRIPGHAESGRTFISKGLLRTARKKAHRNIACLKDIVTSDSPLIGHRTFALFLVSGMNTPNWWSHGCKEDARRKLSQNAFTIDEFLAKEMDEGKNYPGKIYREERSKSAFMAIVSKKPWHPPAPTKRMLSFPENYHVAEIPSGCCGMAGSFGYEKEHYDLSMKVGELVLFPAVRQTSDNEVIAAPGTSCRHQIKDGTGKKAFTRSRYCTTLFFKKTDLPLTLDLKTLALHLLSWQ